MASPRDVLSAPITIGNVTIPGRIAKAAMTEGLADELNRANERHERLYSLWSANHNAGHLLITGNVQVDRRYLERPGNVVIDGPQSPEQMERLRRYARAAQKDGTRCFVQLGHAGRQSHAFVNLKSVGPSDVKLQMPPGVPTTTPRELTKAEIRDVVERFAHAAAVCKEVGFDGVMLHVAHGYLLSSFLNPLVNTRKDEYGGSIENRARIVVECFRECRRRVGEGFPIAVKLNSSDFQKGGMTPEESVAVAVMLEREGMDLLEISGGSYENPSMMLGPETWSKMQSLSALGQSFSSTALREGYFLTFAHEMKKALKRTTPLMVTGGFRSAKVMAEAIAKGDADMIGVGRPLCGMPDAIHKLLTGEISALPSYETQLDLPWYAKFTRYLIFGNFLHMGAFQMWTYYCLLELGDGRVPETKNPNLLKILVQTEARERKAARAMKNMDGVVGLELNAKPTSLLDPKRIGIILAIVALAWFLKSRRSVGNL